ncbi:MAG: ABC transporter substrate-binding protein [Candidatus Rokuibacteriota bacterium]
MRMTKAFVGVSLLALAWASGIQAAQDKVLVYHLPAPPDLLDPAKCSNLRCQAVMWPIYEALVDLSRDSKGVLPGLAESWVVSRDGLTYTFRLRKGVTFHDGTAFDAMAAKINLERNFLKGSRFYTAEPPNVREKVLAGAIRDVIVQDEHTLTITFKDRKLHLLFLVPMVSPEALAKQGRKLGEHPVGTGPFKFIRSTEDEVRLAANPGYWGGRPKLDEISFRIIPQWERTMQEFLAGRIDFSREVEPLYLERIMANPATKLIRVPALSIYYLGFNLSRKPFDDIRVRQAVTKAIDIERMVLFVSRGTAVPAYGPIPPAADGYDPALKKPRFDPEGARRLLREAGHASGLRASLLVNVASGFVSEIAQAVKADLAKIGVAVEVVPISGYPTLVKDVRRGEGDLFIYNWFSLSPDPEIFLLPNFRTASVDNLTRYSNPQVDALLDQAATPRDSTERLELYRKAQTIIVNDAPMVFLLHSVRVSAHHARVSGLDLNVHSFPIDRFVRVDTRPE